MATPPSRVRGAFQLPGLPKRKETASGGNSAALLCSAEAFHEGPTLNSLYTRTSTNLSIYTPKIISSIPDGETATTGRRERWEWVRALPIWYVG